MLTFSDLAVSSRVLNHEGPTDGSHPEVLRNPIWQVNSFLPVTLSRVSSSKLSQAIIAQFFRECIVGML